METKGQLKLVVNDLSGGMNRVDTGATIPATQSVYAQNVRFDNGERLVMRTGWALTTSAFTTSAFGSSAQVRASWVHTPNANASDQEVWAIDDQATPVLARTTTAGSTFNAVTVADAFTAADVAFVRAVSFNGKCFVAGNTAVDRLHLWDGTTFRAVGLTQAGTAPTVADSPTGGTYAAVVRYYRIRWLVLSGSTVIARSEPSSSVSFTPDGAHTAARVTRPTTTDTHTTHWEIEASVDNAVFYRLAQVAIGSTYDDSAATTSYASNTQSQASGLFQVPVSCKHLLVSDNRLIMAGSWETSGYASRIWWTPVQGSLGHGDDERFVDTSTIKNYVDVDSGHGGEITGLSRLLNGGFLIFKRSAIYRAILTGNVTAPYRIVPLEAANGAVSATGIVSGVDENGAGCVYFCATRGVYRYGESGLELVSRDLEPTPGTVAFTTTTPPSVAFDPNRRELMVTTAVSSAPFSGYVLTARSAQTLTSGEVRRGWCELSSTLAALVYLDRSAGSPLGMYGWTGRTLQYFDTGSASVTSASVEVALLPPQLERMYDITDVIVQARPTSTQASSLVVTLYRNHSTASEDTVTQTLSIPGGASSLPSNQATAVVLPASTLQLPSCNSVRLVLSATSGGGGGGAGRLLIDAVTALATPSEHAA